jgi:hypothetical protein
MRGRKKPGYKECLTTEELSSRNSYKQGGKSAKNRLYYQS